METLISCSLLQSGIREHLQQKSSGPEGGILPPVCFPPRVPLPSLATFFAAYETWSWIPGWKEELKGKAGWVVNHCLPTHTFQLDAFPPQCH